MQDWCIYLFVRWFVGFYFIIFKKILFNSEVILDFFLDIGDLLIKEDVDILKYFFWDNEVMIIVLNFFILKNYNFDLVIIWQKDLI